MLFTERKWLTLMYTGSILQVCLVFGQYDTPTTTLSSVQVNELINSIFETKEPSCNCVPMNMCQKYNNSTINTSGEGLIDIRVGQCPSNSLDICCDEKRSPTATPNPPYKRTNSCGHRNENGVGFRITAGNSEAQFGEFPWMIAVMKKKYDRDGEYFRYHCGGSLIHLKVVLTGAHCVVGYTNKPEEIMLRAGEWDSKSEDETIPFQQVVAEKIVIHKEFNSGGLFNDIALIFLKQPFVFAENVDVVCLPPQDENVDNQKCVASGWGKETFDDNVYSNILKRVDLPIIPRSECQTTLMGTRLGPKFRLHESFLCAGGIAGIDTCKGDGGGPLMCPISGKPENYYQVGIVAWGIGCGTPVPGVYVDVAHFRTWIDEQFVENGLGDDMSSYNYS